MNAADYPIISWKDYLHAAGLDVHLQATEQELSFTPTL